VNTVLSTVFTGLCSRAPGSRARAPNDLNGGVIDRCDSPFW
jgi:hypothetical protein